MRERHADALLSSGGPKSVNEPGAPVIDAELLQITPPTRGRCMVGLLDRPDVRRVAHRVCLTDLAMLQPAE